MIRVAVVGAGNMGRNHIRVLKELNDVDLVGVADQNTEVLTVLQNRYAVRGFTCVDDLLREERPQAVVIAVPTTLHKSVALAAITSGAHVLVEKPIAETSAAAEEIISAAERAGVLLTVGHVERFNPAVIAARSLLNEGRLGKLIHLDARRQGPRPNRITDVGVVVDLAVHELDIIRYLSGDDIEQIYAEATHHVGPTHEEMVTCVFRLRNGAIGTLCLSWLTPTKTREIYLTGTRGMFHLNYLTQDLYFYENGSATNATGWDTMSILRGVSEGQMIKHVVQKREPLRAELECFIGAIRGNNHLVVTGPDGMRAIQLAQAILDSAQTRHPVGLASPGPMHAT